jgi:hypothetical protein
MTNGNAYITPFINDLESAAGNADSAWRNAAEDSSSLLSNTHKENVAYLLSVSIKADEALAAAETRNARLSKGTDAIAAVADVLDNNPVTTRFVRIPRGYADDIISGRQLRLEATDEVFNLRAVVWLPVGGMGKVTAELYDMTDTLDNDCLVSVSTEEGWTLNECATN